ncbi:HAE1 family hydrophobic/amphiphilic exporter-1 [Microbacterium resistens]|uniref:HAE1 family hydrophobic/amphiphilic exporter-1 n=1 Tax=Microbacterium resistens TaxID=156977 RepID=A0ABU1S871_9MICO|nr:efflux RND transporter permease subunit [Microbacterium resistens]MDR6865813.1 HAE1 family hydrophobic/amphiphilic exporter-1 [Microbacterium resistens]
MTLLTRLSLANRAVVALFSVLIVGVGLWATGSMKQELLPSMSQPAAVVSVVKPGASAETLDREVVAPLSDALSAVGGVDEVRASTSSGNGQVTVTWTFGGDDDKILADVKTATNAVLATAPDGVQSEVYAGSSSDIPVLSLALTSGDDLDTLADRVEKTLVPAIEHVPGVRKVQVSGQIQERVLVTLNPAELSARSIDPSVVSALLRTAGTVVPAGTSDDGAKAMAIEVGQEGTTVEGIAALPIPTMDGPVPLSAVAAVELAPVPQSTLSRADGRPALGLTITKTPDANAVQVSHAVAAAIDDALPGVGAGATVTTLFDQSTMIEQSTHDLAVEGGLGLVFAVLIILVFLLSPKATVITAVSIPLSLLIAVIGLRVGGFSFNVFTLAALTVAVGRVVDDSIVVIENIARRRGSGGLTPADVRAAVGQVAGAVTASTLTTVAVFLPVALVGGVSGELFRPFALTVTIALLASLLVSLTIVPVLAYWFMRRPSRKKAGEDTPTEDAPAGSAPAESSQALVASGAADEAADEIAGRTTGEVTEAASAERVTRMQRAYLPALRFSLRRPVTVVLVSVIVFAGTIVMSGFLKTDMLGSFADARAVQVEQKMPLDTTLAVADEAATTLEQAVGAVDGVSSYRTTAGELGAPVILDLVIAKDADPDIVLERIRTAAEGLPKGEDITVSTQATQTTSSTIDVIVKSPDEKALAAAAEQIGSALDGAAGVGDVRSDLAAELPVLKVSVDQNAAAVQGFTVPEVGAAIASAVEGERLGKVGIDGTSRDLVLRAQSSTTDPEAIRAMPLPVSALQTQRTQKNAADALQREQEQMSADARAEAEAKTQEQLSELIDTRNRGEQDLAALREQLAGLLASPPPFDPNPASQGAIAALEYQKAVQQLIQGVAGAEASLSGLDEQIRALRTGMDDSAAQQAETDRLTQAQRDLEKLRATPIRVGDIASVEVVTAPATILRIDGARAVTVSVTPAGEDLGQAAVSVQTVLDGLDLPAGVTLDEGGAAAEQAQSFGELGVAMLAAIALVYIVLVATFRSLMQPLLLLVSVPFAATGAIAGLLLTGTPMGIPALIGMLMLIGIVVTNAIVLIDLINEYRRDGTDLDDAVVHGARLRLRPIIMTACATIFALIPMALGVTGGGAFISKSLAIVVIGGLVSSTALTLLLVPALFVLYERRGDRRQARRERRAARRAARRGGQDGDGQGGGVDSDGEALARIEAETTASTPGTSGTPDLPESPEQGRGRLAT